MIKNEPLVSIVMPVFNGEPHLKYSLKSILNQTYSKIELIIINDGSTDNSVKEIKKFYDKRIVLINLQRNKGIENALNLGIKLSKGKYIARMDADDISDKCRISNQVHFLESHPNIGIIGSTGIFINDTNKPIGIINVPLSDFEIKWNVIFKSPFIHSSIIIKKSIFEKNNLFYNRFYEYAEDFDLWYKILKTTNSANLKNPLIYYRISCNTSKSSIKHALQLENTLKIGVRNIRDSFPDLEYSDKELALVIKIHNNIPILQNELEIGLLIYIKLFNLYIISNKNKDPSYLNRIFTTKVSKKMMKIQYSQMVPIIKQLNKINKYWFFDFLLSLPSSIYRRILFNRLNNQLNKY